MTKLSDHAELGAGKSSHSSAVLPGFSTGNGQVAATSEKLQPHQSQPQARPLTTYCHTRFLMRVPLLLVFFV